MAKVEKLAEKFILSYLNWIRHNASQIPRSDRGIFPSYWFDPYQIIIHKNGLDDLAIMLKRRVSGKSDKVSVRVHSVRIEESVLPNLDYHKWPIFSIQDDHHHIVIQGFASGGTFAVSDHPLLTIGTGSEIRLLDLRVEASVEGYPIEFELLWVLTFPNMKYLTPRRAEADAEYDFWNQFQSVLARKIDVISSMKFEENTIKLFRQYIEKVHFELCRLISRKDLTEPQLQNFLDEHYFLLSEDKPIVKKSKVLGDYNTDFTIEHSDGSILLIELQLNRDPIICNGKPSDGFREAIGQIKNWFGWIKQFDGTNLGRYSGLIIIGRKSDYDANRKTIDEIISEINLPIKIKTYDDLNDIIKKIEGYFG